MLNPLNNPISLVQRLARSLNIRPGEGAAFSLMFVQAFVVGAIIISYYTAANALFLAEFGAATIPYVYIVSAGVIALGGLTFSRLQRHIPFSRLLSGTVTFLLLSVLGVWLALQLTLAYWIVFVVMVWLRLLWTISNLTLWTLAGRLFNLDQSKRLFSLLMAGAVFAIILTGLVIVPFVNRFGAINLILVTTFGLTLWLGLLSATLRRFHGRVNLTAANAASPAAPASSHAPFGSLLRNRYISLILTYTVLSTLATYILDFAFVSEVKNQYDDVNALASFFGNYMAISTLVLLVVTGASGFIFSRYGLKVGIIINAIVVALGAGTVVLTNAVFGPLEILFWLVVLTKLCDDVLVISMADTSTRILYQPLPPGQQTQVQSAGEGVVTPLSTGLAGVVLLFFAAMGNITTTRVLYILLAILGLWIAVSFLLNREYLTALKQALTKRRLEPVSLTTVMDRSSLGVLQQGLASPNTGTVIAALNLLAEIQPEALPGQLPALLNHRAVEVRLETLHHIEQIRFTDAIPAIQQHIENENSLVVKGAALRVLAALSDSETFDRLDLLLNDPVPQIRQQVIIGFLRSGDLDRIVAAGEQVNQLVNSPGVDDRILAAQILGMAGLQGLHRSLLRLLEDEVPEVQQAALISARKVKHPDLWPAVVRHLASMKLQATALTTLIAGGEATMPAIASAFDAFSQNRPVLFQLSKACGQIGGERALALLKKALDIPDETVLNQTLASLSQIGYRAMGPERETVQHKIKAEVAQAAWTLAALIDMDAEAGSPRSKQTGDLLRSTLNAVLSRHRARIFLWLSFIYDRQSILQIGSVLADSGQPGTSLLANDGQPLGENSSSEKRAYAFEMIEVLIDPDLKRQVRPLLTDDLPPEQLRQLGYDYQKNSQSRHQRLEQIITGPDLWFNPWVKAVAIYSAGQLAIAELSATVAAVAASTDPLLRETAVWSLGQMGLGADWQGSGGAVDRREHRPHKETHASQQKQNGRKVMLSTIEKVLILKGVSFFVDTPEEALVNIAAVLEETAVQPDAQVFSEGEPGHTLYIIVDGQIRIHNQQQTLAILGENEAFGEMSILDPAPRSATATATTETRLLSLDREVFNGMMADHYDVAQGVMRLLARRLRQAQAQPKL